ncbi:MAG: hypothetical protein K8T20_01790 [Planctomycetes bacterium]|nr:hypothetical protein [Planctomycetota bacterium]
MASPADAAPTLSRLAAQWRIALFVAAMASLPVLWVLAGGGLGLAADRAELDRARRALETGNPREARARAEGVIARRPTGADSAVELRTLVGNASIVAADARLRESETAQSPAASDLVFAAWRAAQGEELGADAAESRRLRLRAARRLLELGSVDEAISEMERLESAHELGAEGRRDLALALASGEKTDQERALALAQKLLAEAPGAREKALATHTLGRVLVRVGRRAEAEPTFAAAAADLKAVALDRDAAEARLDRGTVLLALGRPAEASVILRAILLDSLSNETRGRAGIALLEADAMADDPVFSADLAELRNLPAPPEVLFAARAGVARQRVEAGRRADASAAYAAAFEHLGPRAFPAPLVHANVVLDDLQNLFRYGPDPNDLMALGRAAEGLALSLRDNEAALELAAEIVARRAELADERARTAEQAGAPAGDVVLEARALHGRSAQLRLEAADGTRVLKSHSAENRVLGARELFRGGFHESAVKILRRLANEFDVADDRSAEARWMASRSLQELGRHEEAAAELERFLADHRNAPRWAHDAFVALARSQEALGRLEAAERTLSDFLFHYDNVTPESPRWRDGLFRLGIVQSKMAADLRAAGRDSDAADRAAEAERNLAEAVKRFPAAWDQRFEAEMALGRLAMARRDWERAAARLRSALALPGREKGAESEAAARRVSLLLGESLWQLGETAAALEAFGQAWATTGGAETAVALARMADCHERLGDAKQAARFRERAKTAFEAWRASSGGGRAGDATERLLERLVAGR